MSEFVRKTLRKIRKDGSNGGDESIVVNISFAAEEHDCFREGDYAHAGVRSDGAVVIKPVQISELEVSDER